MQWNGLTTSPCNLCPRECHVDRKSGRTGFCLEDDRIYVARAALHMWEEPCISGSNGSGTVFFCGCNLRCVYCQNHEIAAGKSGKQISTGRLADIFIELQEKGAANINLVTPDHYADKVSQAVLMARKNGLTIPIVYNCSGYTKREVIRNLSGIVDVFLTDFKYMDSELAAKFSLAPDYPTVAQRTLAEMVDIICNTIFDEKGMMQKGVIVRHLLLPGHKQNAKDVIRYVYETYGDSVYISLMNQYTPCTGIKLRTDQQELYRKVTKREYDAVVDYAIELGVKNAFIQEGDTAKESFVPEFDGVGIYDEEGKKSMEYENAWLSYKKNTSYKDKGYFVTVFTVSPHTIIHTATKEIMTAAEEILGQQAKLTEEEPGPGATGIFLKLEKDGTISEEGYHIYEKDGLVVITAGGERGILYGSFACIRYLQMGRRLKGVDFREEPSNPLRMLNHWDNMDGSIERGYSGSSFFFREEDVLVGARTVSYARLAASMGINAVVINNVNVRGNATRLIEEDYVPKVGKMAQIFAEYGIRLFLSLNFAAPMELSELTTADSLDEEVRCWWKEKMAKVFSEIPNLGGFLVKADSEGRPGPFTYGRDHADGANMLAEAAAPFGGLIIWRCFVYNCQQDWRDYKTDRAKSGYDTFAPLDGRFLDNVILQVKNGPMDFQVREPVHPLLGGMEKTNQILEVQIAQEYTGQQRHVCYLIPMFKEILDFRTYCKEKNDAVADIVAGRTWGNRACGMAAVSNTGDDVNWTGHDLAAANLYGFGRLSFQTTLSAEEIAKEWIACTFGNDAQVMDTILTILMMSWPAYEKYNAPLGVGWMVTPSNHYGPSVDGYEYDRWGTYHRADHEGIGVDRSDKGTGYAMQYHGPNASTYNGVDSCPDELKLFFHHVPYTYRLRSGKTVIQHIYDTHFEGAEEAEKMKCLWQSLEGKIPEEVYERTLRRFEHQAWHAKEWCDQINSSFYRKSGISDEQGRKIY